MSKDRLIPKHRAFVEEYISNGFKAMEAYLKVYPGVSNEVASAAAGRLLGKVKIKAEVQRSQDKVIKKLEITKEGLIQDLIDIKDANKQSLTSIKAIELIVKMLGYNAPIESKSQITIKGDDFPLFGPLDKE